MKRNFPFIAFGVAALGLALVSTLHSEEKAHKIRSVSMRKMADCLHSVIVADRQAYAQVLAQQSATDAKCAANLPVPEQLLKTAARSIQTAGAEFSYVVRSLHPINPNNAPQTEAEQTGIEQVTKNPTDAFYAEEELGGRSYFTAVYADRATLASCADCHNRQPQSQRNDLKPGEMMGAVVIRVPLEF